MALKLSSCLIFLILFSCKKDNDENIPPAYSIEDDFTTLTLLHPDLKESSGLIMIDGNLWTHNDSGADPKIYNISEEEPDIKEKVNIIDAFHKDWEDLTQDDTHLYIGDFGNNNGDRQDLIIYKVLKSNLPNDTEAEAIHFRFSDQTNFDHISSMHNFNCEAMISLGDFIYVFSKNHLDQKTKVYQIPKIPGTHIAQKLASFDSDGLITGAEIDPISNTLCLVGYNHNDLDFDTFVWILYDFTDNDFFDGKSKRVNLPIQTQMEGICYKGNGKYLISSENENGINASLYLFDAQKWK